MGSPADMTSGWDIEKLKLQVSYSAFLARSVNDLSSEGKTMLHSFVTGLKGI